jgi:hypothetical protein
MLDRIEAAGELATAADATVEDLAACLPCRGVIAELAAAGLYRLTGRPKPRKLRDYANRDKWEQYLIGYRLAGSQPGWVPPAADGAT